MQLSKNQLDFLAAKYQLKADKAYDNYQATGISRYDRERRNAEDIAEALRAAANSVDDHTALGHLRAEFVWYAGQADAALAENASREKLVEILEHIITSASVSCHYARRERPSEKGGA